MQYRALSKRDGAVFGPPHSFTGNTMKQLILAAILSVFSLAANAEFYEQITTSVLDDDANGIAQDQTTGGAGDLTLNGALVTGGVATMAEAQIVAIESTGNISGVTFTVTGTDADGNTVNEAITGPNNSTVKSTYHFKTVTQIAVDGAVGTNTEVGVLAADGMVTKSVKPKWEVADFALTVSAELSAGTGTFGAQYTVDRPDSNAYTDSFSWDANWREAEDADGNGLDSTANTATGDINIYSPVRAVRRWRCIDRTSRH